MNLAKDNKEIVKKLYKKVIVSCQAASDEPFYPVECITAMVKSVIDGGAMGLRLAGAKHIAAIRQITTLPIIGITKPGIIPNNFKDIVYITPTFEDAKSIHDAGCDIIALDATNRPRPKESLKQLINLIHSELKCPVMADVSNLDEAIAAEKFGADIISTTLSGYTSYTKYTDGPDFDLLKAITNQLYTPVILEGRIESPEDVVTAFDIGAHAVVIGSIITRPHYITRRYVEVTK